MVDYSDWRRLSVTLLLALAPGLSCAVAQAPPPVVTTLYSFTGQHDGEYPYAGVTISKGGVLYGTTLLGPGITGFGTLYELKPPAAPGGTWTETVLHSFTGPGGDGAYPYAPPAIAPSGGLFGTTDGGGAFSAGTAFEWTASAEMVLHSFGSAKGDGAGPIAALTAGPGGVFYGTTSGGGSAPGGTVFELIPPAAGGAWTETVLYSFGSQNGDGRYPNAGLTAGANGTLYGTTQSGGAANHGTVFQLTPPASPGGAWTESVLYSFSGGSDGGHPLAGVTPGKGGVLYGTASSGGTALNGAVFELMPPAAAGGPWTETVLYSFTGQSGDGTAPYGGVALGSNGGLYGSTFSGGTYLAQGTLFELEPPASAGGAWTEIVLHRFTGKSGDGANPYAGLVFQNGMFYGTTTGGGHSGLGTVFQLIP